VAHIIPLNPKFQTKQSKQIKKPWTKVPPTDAIKTNFTIF
jgi:hypothetical protein